MPACASASSGVAIVSDNNNGQAFSQTLSFSEQTKLVYASLAKHCICDAKYKKWISIKKAYFTVQIDNKAWQIPTRLMWLIIVGKNPSIVRSLSSNNLASKNLRTLLIPKWTAQLGVIILRSLHAVNALSESRGWQGAVLWFGLVEEHLDASSKISTDKDMTTAALGSLLYHWIDGRSVGTCTVTPSLTYRWASTSRRGSFRIFGSLHLLLSCFYLSNYAVGIGGEDSTSDHRIMSFDALPKVITVATYTRKLGVVMMGLPDVDALIFGAAHDVLAVRAEACLNLTAYVNVAFVLARQV